MTRIISTVILIVATWGLYSCSSSIQSPASLNCIEQIIAQDEILGKVRNHCPEKKSLNICINEYVNGLNALNFDECPNSFKKSFQKHIGAWIEMGKFVATYDQIHGEMHDAFDEIESSQDSLIFKKHLSEIWSTWREIEAQIPMKN